MEYYVIWSDGQKFGPADETTLRQWAFERRIAPETILEDVITGRRVPASEVIHDFPAPNVPQSAGTQSVQESPVSVSTPNEDQPDLKSGEFQIPQEFPMSSGSPYPVQSYYTKGKSDTGTAWGLIIAGFVATFLIPCCWYFLLPGSMGMVGAGIYFANKAKKNGDNNGQAAFVTGIICLCFQFLLIMMAVIFFATLIFGKSGFRRFP